MRLITATLLTFGLTGTALATDLPEPKGRVLLTIGGQIAGSNTTPLNPDAINLSGFLDLDSEKAIAFDDIMLADLEQHQISAKILGSTTQTTYSGPRLSDILRTVGATGKTARPMALDGYQAAINWELIETYQPILATHADGKALAIGQLGPSVVVFPVVEDAEVYDSFKALQVFAAFYIEVE